MNTIPVWRQMMFYLGMVVSIIGLILFLSVFISFIRHFGDFGNFEEQTRNEMSRALGGVILLAFGEFLRRLGARGMSGSGIILDPEQAREDLKPYSHMIGGMASDVLEKAKVSNKQIMIKCQSCKTLNEENSKICQECGKPL